MADFLLELLSEEIPARMQAKARADLARLFEAELKTAGLSAEAIETYATPRRLVLIARGLPQETAATSEELKGPRTSAPPQALEGFLRKTGLSQDQLTDRDGIWFAAIEKPGQATVEVLAEAIPNIVRSFPWPKSMRWGAASLSTESLRWVRPLQGIVAMLDEKVVDFEIGDVRSGAATIGHRFRHPGPITLGGASDYLEKLKACHVIVDQDERARIVREGAAAAASAAGLSLVEDEGLVLENAGLTEWPVPLLGRFDPSFLQVPREVIQLTMRTNQKYFALNNP
ncbi:MAG: glycine--tRNA ligase subunit beta, partial [Alphaproteobacteria bacterium]|nr:glycine--tRNA ligase subunit beta [Alphaproteobacteria bacterium]